MINRFLADAGWAGAEDQPLVQDASARRYSRHIRPRDGARAILMEAPVTTPAERAAFAGFQTIGAHLRGLGLSAPKELAADPDSGLMLLEDLGDLSFARLLEDDTDAAHSAYGCAAAVLDALAQAQPPAGLPCPDAETLARMTGLTFDLLPDSADLRAALVPALADALARFADGPSVLALRDVHADNLMWLPGRTGLARVGLLDFQDALCLPRGYDLASLLEDPRREIPEKIRTPLRHAFGDTSRLEILSLQRNLRILGVFHRLATQRGKPGYARFLPRTRALIARAAAGFDTLRPLVDALLERSTPWGPP